MFALLSMPSEYSQKIKPFIAMTPVVTVNHIKGLLKAVKPLFFFFHLKPLSLFQLHSFKQNILRCLLIISFAQMVFTTLLTGFDSELNFSRAPVYLASVPESTSLQNMIHFG